MTERFTSAEAQALAEEQGYENAEAFFEDHPDLDPGIKPIPKGGKSLATDIGDKTVEASPDSDLGVEALNRELINHQIRQNELRTKQFETARASVLAQRYGPSVSERLLQMGAAFFQPKSSPGFAGTMANVAPVLARQSTDTREGEEKRSEALRALQERYDTGALEGEGSVIENKLKLAKLKADMAKGTMGQWSDSRGRFVSKTDPSMSGNTGIIRGADGKSHRFVDFSDGTRHVEDKGGVWDVIDDAGNVLGQADARGNRIDGTS